MSFRRGLSSISNVSNISYSPRLVSSIKSPISDEIAVNDLRLFARKKQNPVSLLLLMETGKGALLKNIRTNSSHSNPLADSTATASEKVQLQVASFLHRELPIRLAHRAVELESIEIFGKSIHIQQVCNWYKESFRELRSCPAPDDLEKERTFSRVVQSIFERHSYTLITMAKGAHDIRKLLDLDIATFAQQSDIQHALDTFYLSRIGIRMLIGQYLALKQPQTDTNMIGLICQKASPYSIAMEVIQEANYICTRTHGDAPEVEIHGRTDLTFPYVPSHIHYVLLELVKNSMRATVEKHSRGSGRLPPIRIVIADGEDNEDVVIKVSDEGGGIRRSHMSRIWSYLFTTASPDALNNILGASDGSADVRDFDTATPLAGLGYGLPIARNYARYFGGDLVIMSMEGYGTDSFIYLPRLGDRSSVLS